MALKVTATIGPENTFSAENTDGTTTDTEIVTMFTNWVNKVNVPPTGDGDLQTHVNTLADKLMTIGTTLDQVAGKLNAT